MIPLATQFKILYKHKLVNFFKDKKFLMMKAMLVLGLSFILFLTFLDLGDPVEDPNKAIQNRTGFIFFLTCAHYLAGLNLSSTTILPEKLIFVKD